MTFLSHPTGRRAGARAARRPHADMLRHAAATTAFFLAVGFTAAFVFGFLGH